MDIGGRCGSGGAAAGLLSPQVGGVTGSLVSAMSQYFGVDNLYRGKFHETGEMEWPFGVTQLGTHVRIVSLNKLDPITTSNNVTLNRTRLEFAVKVDTASAAMRVSELISAMYNSSITRRGVSQNFTDQLVRRKVTAGVSRYTDFEQAGFRLIENTSLPSNPYVYLAEDRGVNITGTNGGIIALFEGDVEQYEIVLTSQPHSDVKIVMEVLHSMNVAASQSSEPPSHDLDLSVSEIFFNALNWDVPQKVVIHALLPIGDVVETEEDFRIVHHVSSGDVRYNTHPCSPQTFEEGPLLVDSMNVVVMEKSTPSPTATPTDAPTGKLFQ